MDALLQPLWRQAENKMSCVQVLQAYVNETCLTNQKHAFLMYNKNKILSRHRTYVCSIPVD